MTNGFLNQELDSALRFLNNFHWKRGLLSVGILLFSTIYAFSQPLTLKEAVLRSIDQGLNHSIDEQRRSYFTHKEKFVDERKVQKVFRGKTGFSKNEVADSRDLESKATQGSQINLSYQETYENGLSWTLSQTYREDKAISGNQGDESYEKTLLYGSMPIYGTASSINRIKRDQGRLQIDQERILWDNQLNQVQYEVARAFLETGLQAYTLEKVIEKEKIHQGKIDRLFKVPLGLTAIDKEILQLQQLNEEQNVSLQKNSFRQAILALELLIGVVTETQFQLPTDLPQLTKSSEEITQAYLQNSLKIKGLKQKLLALQQTTELIELDERPDFSINGFIGKSTLDDSKGSNYGVNLLVTYNFGGGQPENLAAQKSQMSRYNLEIKLAQKQIAIQVHQDLQKLEASKNKATFLIANLKITQKKVLLSQKKFELGAIQRETVADLKMKAIDLMATARKASIESWISYLNVLQNMHASLIDKRFGE